MLGLQKRLARGDLLVRERRRDVVHGRARDAGGRQQRDALRGRAPAEQGLELVEELRAVAVAVREGAEARVLEEVRPADRAAEALPQGLLRARDDDPAVARLEVLERDHRLVRRV